MPVITGNAPIEVHSCGPVQLYVNAAGEVVAEKLTTPSLQTFEVA